MTEDRQSESSGHSSTSRALRPGRSLRAALTGVKCLAMHPGPVRHTLDRCFGGLALILMREPAATIMARLGLLTGRIGGSALDSARAWPPAHLEVPSELATTPGIPIDRRASDDALRTGELRSFWSLNPRWEDWTNAAWWRIFLRVLPRYLAGTHSVNVGRSTTPLRAVRPADPVILTRAVRQEAQRLGFSAVGFSAYDPRWSFAGHRSIDQPCTVIVCVAEEAYAAEQSAPGGAHQCQAMRLLGDQMVRTAKLARHLRELGYDAEAHDGDGPYLYIPYAVAAGLGQMGLNGQLLTPAAGSRCTLTAVTTTAQLVYGSPVDYGIPAICDRCRACVRRCPVGAIPAQRGQHRGVTKSKIKSERCLPVVAQTDGCAICSKVCPVQRYGLWQVVDHYRATGQIKGIRTDELEGYRWPLDGAYYGAGSKPAIDSDTLLRPREMDPYLPPTAS